MHDSSSQFASSQFANAAREAFRFLESDRGFQELSLTLPSDFQSAYATFAISYVKLAGSAPQQLIRLSHTPARGELFLECVSGDPDDHADTVDIDELAALSACGSRLHFSEPISAAIGQPPVMAEQFANLASALRKYGSRFFNQDMTLWNDVRDLREQRRREYEQADEQRVHEQTLHDSELAFQARDWARVVELLERVSGQLTKAQTQRLSYARKQLLRKD